MNLRLKAFAIHLLISASIVSIFFYFALLVWYPDPYDYFYSSFNILKIVLLVDLIIGPLLTLIIYDIKKSRNELRRDLSIVALIQILAFAWGVHVTYDSRPVFLVFSNKDFYVLAKGDVDLALLKDNALMPAFWEETKMVYVKPPKDSEELTALYKDYLMGEKPQIALRLDRYLPLTEGFDYITQFSIDISEVKKNASKKLELDKFLKARDNQLSNYVFFPVNGTNKKATLVFERETGKMVTMIEFEL